MSKKVRYDTTPRPYECGGYGYIGKTGMGEIVGFSQGGFFTCDKVLIVDDETGELMSIPTYQVDAIKD